MKTLGLGLSHNASAVLLEGTQIVAGVEEERLNRVKNWDSVPLNAIAFSLETAGITLKDIDAVAIAGNESVLDQQLQKRLLANRSAPVFDRFRAHFANLLRKSFGHDVQERLVFVDHHLSHAFSAYGAARENDCLLVTLDGAGDGISGIVLSARGPVVDKLAEISPDDSFGLLYLDVTRFAGYTIFDEYKVMGLAPYGDPACYRDVFSKSIELAPEGRVSIRRGQLVADLRARLPPRRTDTEFSKPYKDLAASLQEAVEKMALHVIGHFQRTTGHRTLCYAGGFAQNCSFNGKLAYAGMFDRIYVSPAANDAGLALGAAYWTARQDGDHRHLKGTEIFIGPPPSEGRAQTANILHSWRDWIDYEEATDVEVQAAQLLANDFAVAWVQGRSEFGPRALGNRSILADPRPSRNKDRINDMIKKREGYRPFAPSVLIESAGDFFEVPKNPLTDFHAMSIVLRVREDRRKLLGAITHVDGTARVQTVSKQSNPSFWRLIHEFGRLTGIPILLNTSCNNHREPIVSSVHDALTCFLTTGLDRLVVDGFIVKKRGAAKNTLASMYVTRHPAVILAVDAGGFYSRASHLKPIMLSRRAFDLLVDATGTKTLGTLADEKGIRLDDAVFEELLSLWDERHLCFAPQPCVSQLRWPSDFDVQWC